MYVDAMITNQAKGYKRMNISKKDNAAYDVRLLSVEALMVYLGVGRNTADKIGKEAGAKKKIGKRALYDREIIDRYVDSLGA